MPTYEYACKSCSKHLEVVQKFTDDALTTCPSCSGELRKVFGTVGISFKGSGFYKTDSRAPSSSKTAETSTFANPENKSGNNSSENKSSDSQAGSSENKSGESKAGENKSSENRSGESKSKDSRPGDRKPSGTSAGSQGAGSSRPSGGGSGPAGSSKSEKAAS